MLELPTGKTSSEWDGFEIQVVTFVVQYNIGLRRPDLTDVASISARPVESYDIWCLEMKALFDYKTLHDSGEQL